MSNNIIGDELMAKFGFKLDQDPIDLKQFQRCFEILDPSLNRF